MEAYRIAKVKLERVAPAPTAALTV
jgi:hypothetical protein